MKNKKNKKNNYELVTIETPYGPKKVQISGSDVELPLSDPDKTPQENVDAWTDIMADYSLSLRKAGIAYRVAVEAHGEESDEALTARGRLMGAMSLIAPMMDDAAKGVTEAVGDAILAEVDWNEVPRSES